MKKVTSNKLILFCLLLLAVNFGVKAQDGRHSVPVNYIFSPDSLKGFDENSAKQGALSVGVYGEEFKVYMYYAKREYIDNKFGIVRKPVVDETYSKTIPYVTPPSITAKGKPGNPIIAVASCTNEDFEEQGLVSPVPSTVNVTTTGFINGWLSQGAINSGAGANNCTSSYAYGNPNPIQLIAPGTNGHTDAIIGAGYKIYSVYGNTTVTYPNAALQDPFNHYGDWFVKLNNQTNGSSVNRISKTFPVTSSNALFQFAFISVLEGSHGCCDGGGFSLKVKIGCGPAPPTVTSCPQFTAAVQPGCVSPGNTTTYLTSTVSPSWKYNKWKLNTLDLTSFIGNCVTIEVTAYDCTYTGHAGYVYFDAQCSPMDVIGNGNSFPAGTPSISLPTCGAGSTATITAPPVTGGYTWTAPGGPGSFTTVPGGQTIITTNSGQYTLTMNPPGSCSPIVRYIDVIISPAPNLAITTNSQPSCSTPTNGVSIQMSSGTPNTTLTPSYYTVSFSPSAPTGTIGAGPNTATYTGLAPGSNTITITDSVGCIATQVVNMNIIPPIPTFTLDAPNTILGCNPNFITATAVATSTNPAIVPGSMTYTWTSASSSTVGTIVNLNQVGSYTVTGQGTYTTASGNSVTCTSSTVLAVTGSTAVPTCAVLAPVTRTLICNGACAQFTAVSSTTTNVIGTWDGPGPVQVVPPTGTPMLLCANAPGTYTANFCSTVSGCCASQTVAVYSNTSIPTISVNVATSNGFTINCTNPNVVMNINSSGTCAPIGYTWTPVANPSASVTPPTGGYTVTVPGQYIAQFHDCNMCYVSTMVNIYIDTLRPSPASITNLPSNSYTINCYYPTLIATGVTNPLLSPSQYSWTVPGPLTFPSNTIMVSMGTFTGTTTSINYTVSAIGPNGCVGKQRVTFNKDATVPAYVPVSTPSLGITCANPCVAMSPSSTSTVPISYTFTSPAPTQTATTSGALMCVPGTYTMNYMNILNGCPGVSTVNVNSNLVAPALVPAPTYTLFCGQNVVQISANTQTTSPTYSYSWEPATNGTLTAGMSCLGGTACASPSVNMAGLYTVLILNTQNGCTSTNTMMVVPDGINAGFIPDPVEGFSPLTVNFSNTSQIGSLTSGSVTTFWNFGNGITYTTSGLSTNAATVLTSPSTIYQSAGSYTVTLVVAQYAGTVSCVGTATAVIKVELPSKMDVPNVFTPNADGVNDVFMLQTTNLTNITCTIFDRWGVKMYDVTAEKGNIEWDGKNFGKKDVPAGTYFYILKATGKDVRDYEQKGTISLYR